MKILKSTTLKKRKCEFGDFELVPDTFWEISQSFIDFESRLLVVSTSDTDESNWTDYGDGTHGIPTKEYIVDSNTCEILPRVKWSKYFSYEPSEVISKDGKYKQVTTRIHNEKGDSDSIHEELIEIASNKTLSSSEGIAFREEKRATALESLYRKENEQEKRKAEIDAIPTLQEFFRLELEKLKSGVIILDYFNSDYIFKLVYNGTLFEILKVQSHFRHNIKLDSLLYQKENSFNTIEEFVTKYWKDKDWFLNHSPINKKKYGAKSNQLLKKFILAFFNKIRASHDFSFDEYDKMYQWEDHFYQSDSVKSREYKQFCPSCKKSVSYYPRYPKYICEDCSSKAITDESGLELSFSNIGLSGGLRITYKKDGEIIKEDNSQLEKLCIIEGKRFIASEARYGGIVIQTEE